MFPWDFHEKNPPCSDFRAKTPYVPTDLSLISLIHRGTSLLSQNRTSDSHAEYNRGGSRPPICFVAEKKYPLVMADVAIENHLFYGKINY